MLLNITSFSSQETVYDQYIDFTCDAMPFSLEFRSSEKCITHPPMDGQTDGQMDGQMDKPSYRDAWI